MHSPLCSTAFILFKPRVQFPSGVFLQIFPHLQLKNAMIYQEIYSNPQIANNLPLSTAQESPRTVLNQVSVFVFYKFSPKIGSKMVRRQT